MSFSVSDWNPSRVESMKKYIKQRRAVEDTWQVLQNSEGQDAAVVPASGRWIVPLSVWVQQRAQLIERGQELGVILEPADDPAALSADIAGLAVIAIRFPTFTDGRGFSAARLLRERYDFSGELRAVGDIFRDQIFALARCGFDAFVLREGEDECAAIEALDTFSEVYQAANDRGPLFERRFARPGQP
jgi:uncharacterized protein (DUF934 family)